MQKPFFFFFFPFLCDMQMDNSAQLFGVRNTPY